ncbi:MAG: KUP/HAK/KT family potassium transporter [Chitinophagaceae bacterium]
MDKFIHGGYITLMVGGLMFLVMYVWYRARKIKNRYVEFVRMEHYIPKIQELSNDSAVPKVCDAPCLSQQRQQSQRN